MSKTALYLLALVNLLGFAFMIVMNVMANALPINGKTTGELSDVYPNLFVPAGLTFSIWGVIYILLTLFVIYQGVVVIKMSTGGAGFLENIHIWFSLSCLFNGGWILAWHHQKVGLSLLIMLGLLACLLIIYLRLGIGKGTVPGATRYLVHVPFSIYLGWISIATIANITAWLVHTGWNGWGISQATWTVVVLAAAVVLLCPGGCLGPVRDMAETFRRPRSRSRGYLDGPVGTDPGGAGHCGRSAAVPVGNGKRVNLSGIIPAGLTFTSLLSPKKNTKNADF